MSNLNMTKATRHVFVSYARADSSKVSAIIDELRLSGLDVWIDQEGIKGATFWRKEIVEALTQCAVVLFFASRHSCSSDSVMKELALASEEAKPILPVFLEPVELSPELRFQIAGVQHIAWHEDRERALRQIIAALESYVPRAVFGAGAVLPPLNLRARRRSHRWLWPVITTAAIAIATATVARLWMQWKSPQEAPDQPAPSPTLAPVQMHQLAPASTRREEAKPFLLQSAYYVETVTQSSDYNPYLGLRVRYKVLVTQNGRTLEARGEKISEVTQGEEQELSGRGRTPISLTGHVEIPAAGMPRILLNGMEGSTSRGDFSSMFDLKHDSSDLLTGTFKSTAANASGTAVWIPEKQWLATKWRVP